MKYALSILFCLNSVVLSAQTKPQQYPTPEYSNEIYFFKKDSAALVRLEKSSSKIEAKTKFGGFGGADNGCVLEGKRSTMRLASGNNLSFIYFIGQGMKTTTAEADSAIAAGGMDMSAMSDPMAMMNDPSRTTALYNMNVEKGNRKLTLQSYQGMGILGKSKESTKYTLSIKKIKEGYYELQVDKPLPKGEYAFVVTGYGSMDGSSLLFAFGVD